MWLLVVLIIVVGVVIYLRKRADNQVESGADTAYEVDETDFTAAERRQLSDLGLLERAEADYERALSGDGEAMTAIACAYNRYLDNPEKSFWWMEQASRAGDSDATYFLGTYYRSGYGVEVNGVAGMGFILIAAQEGNSMAIEHLRDAGMTDDDLRNNGVAV